MKFRATSTTTKEFVTELSDYPEGTTEQRALELEREAANDDPWMVTDGGDTTVTVERID